MTNIVKNKNGIEFDIDAIATDLNGKMDRDCTNRSDAGSGVMANMAMPSNTSIDVTLNASGSKYTAPANGYYNIAKNSTAAGQFIDLINESNGYWISHQHYRAGVIRLAIPVKKGDVLRIDYNAVGTLDFFKFIYAVGSEHEAT